MIKQIIDAGFEPIVIFVAENTDLNTAYEIETALIKKFGRKDLDEGGILANRAIDQRSLGGGRKGMKHTKPRSQEHIDKQRQSRKGYRHSAETIAKIVSKHKGVKRSDEVRAKYRSIHALRPNPCAGLTGSAHPVFGYKHSEDTIRKRQNRMSKEFVLTDPSGNTIEVRNLSKFCKDNVHSYYLVRNSKSGWKCKLKEQNAVS